MSTTPSYTPPGTPPKIKFIEDDYMKRVDKINSFPGIEKNPFERQPTKPVLTSTRPKESENEDVIDATIYEDDVFSS